MNDYDAHQLNFMLSRISDFKSGKLSLHSLIKDLEDLMEVLEEYNEDWVKSFYKYWGSLEEVYAVALDQEKTELDQTDHEIINKALNNLVKLVETRLGPEKGLPKG